MENRFGRVLEEIDKARRGLAVYAAVVLALTGVSYLYAGKILTKMVALLNRPLVAYDPSEGFFATLSIALV